MFAPGMRRPPATGSRSPRPAWTICRGYRADETRRARSTRKPRMPSSVRAQNHGDAGRRLPLCDPGLSPIQHPILATPVARPPGGAPSADGILDPKSGSGKPEAARSRSPIAARGSQRCFWSFRSERQNGVHHQRTLHRHELCADRNRRAPTLLHHQPILRRCSARRSPYPSRFAAEEPQPAQPPINSRETALRVAVANDRESPVPRRTAARPACRAPAAPLR